MRYENKMQLVCDTLHYVVAQLRAHDRLSLVAFDSSPRRLTPLRRMTEDGKRLALRVTSELEACGGTDIAAALQYGAKVGW